MAAIAVAAYFTAGAAANAYYWAAAQAEFAAGTALSIGGLSTSTTVLTGVVGGAVGGATFGAGSALMAGGSGRDVLRAGVKGGVSGAITGGVEGYYGNSWNWSRLAMNAAANGISAELAGGSFREGAKFGLATGTASWTYTKMVGYSATWEPGGDAVPKGSIEDPPVQGANNVGLARRVIDADSMIDRWFAEGGYVSRTLNMIPGGNAVAGMHDALMVAIEKSGGSVGFGIFNLPMVPVAGIHAATALFDGPIGYSSYSCMRQDKCM